MQTSPMLLQQVLPPQLVQKATGPLESFLTIYGQSPILCIDLSASPDGDLEYGLTAAMETGEFVHNIGFHTVVGGSKLLESGRATHGFSAPMLMQRLLQRRHFMLPLAKHASDAMSEERIGVGRARNRDVVLRHASVSKFHAWFQLDNDGTVYVADAGSTNGTKVDGKSLTPRELVAVEPGTPVSFGKVTALVCEPAIVWEAFHR